VYPIKKLEGVEGAFFGVYDGHGGSWCANYLRDNLHELIFNDPYFPKHIKAAIRNAFLKAEREIIRNAIHEEETKRVGSCAVVVLIVGKYMYVANLGDSRVIISGYFDVLKLETTVRKYLDVQRIINQVKRTRSKE